MKKFLLTLAAAAITMSAAAATVEFDLTNPASFGVTPADANDRVYPASFSKDGVTVTINNGEGVADNAKLSFFTGASGAVDFRCGKSNKSSNIVITAPANITKIDFTGTPAFNEVSNGVWEGDAASVTLNTNGQVKLNAMAVTYGEAAPATPVELYTMLDETLTEMPADWTINNVSLAEGLEYVWSWKVYNGKGYLNASAFAGAAKAAEAYVISPVIDLTKAKECTVSFDHAAKFQTTLRTLCGLVVREEGATEWTALEIPAWPEAGTWAFAYSGNINLAAYDGKKIQLGFKYGSTADGADTWEIKNLVIKGIGSGSVTPGPDPTPEVVTVNNIKETVALESGAKIKVNYALTVGYVVRNQVFVCDEAGEFIQLYGANTLAVGDVIPAGWEGTYELYYGTPEIKFSSLPDATAGVFTPKTVAAADITTALVNHVVKIENVVFAEATPAEKANFTGKVGDIELSFRNNYALASVEAGTYTVTVVVTIYNNAPSLYVIEYNAGSTAVDNIAVDAAAPVEYFNLQGIRVANPENGVFIRRQGCKVSKIVIR